MSSKLANYNKDIDEIHKFDEEDGDDTVSKSRSNCS